MRDMWKKYIPPLSTREYPVSQQQFLSELLISDGFILCGIKKWIGVVVVALLGGKWMVYGG